MQRYILLQIPPGIFCQKLAKLNILKELSHM